MVFEGLIPTIDRSRIYRTNFSDWGIEGKTGVAHELVVVCLIYYTKSGCKKIW
jgi:hypothetical protein